MSVLTFWSSIDEGGRARVTSPDIPQATEIAALETFLRMRDQRVRRELAGHAPELDLLAAKWAAIQLYRAAQFLLYREIAASVVTEWLAKPCPTESNAPSTVYSVDLSFYYLPGFVKQAAAVSKQDPLTLGLLAWAREWPLSSVGIPKLAELKPERLTSIAQHPSLRTLYADRVIERKDKCRLNEPWVREAVRAALGAHTNWFPEMSAAFAPEDAIKSSP